jgi:hypothetical protein
LVILVKGQLSLDQWWDLARRKLGARPENLENNDGNFEHFFDLLFAPKLFITYYLIGVNEFMCKANK